MNKDTLRTHWDVFLCTFIYSGFCPFAPGTMGALTATLLWAAMSLFLPYAELQFAVLGLVVVVTCVSIPSIVRLEKIWGEDPSRVVVDEAVGVWITLLAVPATDSLSVKYLSAFGAFVLFRLFDIFKPLGIRKMEDVPNGWGVMLDDILSGIYGSVVLWIAVRLLVSSQWFC